MTEQEFTPQDKWRMATAAARVIPFNHEGGMGGGGYWLGVVDAVLEKAEEIRDERHD